MTVDSTLTFAARRNVPIRYNRGHVEKTIQAMDRVEEIRARREKVFYRKRMAENRERERMENAKIVAENEHLLPRQRASEKMQEVEMAESMRQEIAEELVEELPVEPVKIRQKMKRKMRIDGTVENVMEVD